MIPRWIHSLAQTGPQAPRMSQNCFHMHSTQPPQPYDQSDAPRTVGAPLDLALGLS